MARHANRPFAGLLFPKGRCGFNRMELVIVLVILVVVIALFATFVPHARERASRLRCADNLRQMGEGVFVFRDQRLPPCLPASRIADGYATWAVQIAPYLDRRKAGELPE